MEITAKSRPLIWRIACVSLQSLKLGGPILDLIIIILFIILFI